MSNDDDPRFFRNGGHLFGRSAVDPTSETVEGTTSVEHVRTFEEERTEYPSRSGVSSPPPDLSREGVPSPWSCKRRRNRTDVLGEGVRSLFVSFCFGGCFLEGLG